MLRWRRVRQKVREKVAGRQWVQDKKLLWRANLYIDEGANDWNNQNRWVEGNEWNHSPKRLEGEVEVNTADPGRLYSGGAAHWTTGSGGQVVGIGAYTPLFCQEDPSNERYSEANVVKGKVAYDCPIDSSGTFLPLTCMDSPFVFNKRLLDQKAKTRGGEAIAGVWPPTGFTLQQMNAWSVTTAAANRWNNYRKNPVAGNHPALPGIGLLFEDHYTEDPPPVFPGVNQNLLGHMGTDCVGFVQRSASYSGNTYLLDDYGEATWGASDVSEGTGTRRLLQKDSNINLFTSLFDKTQYSADGATPASSKEIASRIVPGDVFFYDGHIGIVQDVTALQNANPGNKIGVLNCIATIESTWGGNTCHVTRRRFSDYESRSNWVIARLK